MNTRNLVKTLRRIIRSLNNGAEQVNEHVRELVVMVGDTKNGTKSSEKGQPTFRKQL
jgi:hypothetical protein